MTSGRRTAVSAATDRSYDDFTIRCETGQLDRSLALAELRRISYINDIVVCRAGMLDRTAAGTDQRGLRAPTTKQPVRDLWLHEDLGEFDNRFSATVPPHGTVLVKIGAGRKFGECNT